MSMKERLHGIKKKAVIGATVAMAAIGAVAGTDKKQTDTNTVAKTQEVAIKNKLKMPSWIPTTTDGKFDEKKAEEQAEMLWTENGKDILQYADDVKAGMPEEIAFAKYAKKLAKGDKEKEKQILSLYDVVKETAKKRNGEMQNTIPENMMLASIVVIGALISSGLLLYKETDDIVGVIKEMAKPSIVLGGIGVLAMTATMKGSTFFAKKDFVSVKKAFYDSYKQQNNSKGYTMTDMQTTKKMIEMAQKTKSVEK